MRLCPNCRSELRDQGVECGNCSWIPQECEGVPIFLSKADQEDKSFIDYVKNYDELSKADLNEEIVDGTYLANQAAKLTSYLDGNPNSILEVGVGQGFLLRKLSQSYPESKITAVDISIPFLRYVKSKIENIECIVANAENLPFMDEFDLVVASDILEHVINPIDFLLSVNIALKQEGLMALRVPFEDNMLQYSKLLGCEYKFAHLRNFSERNLKLILNQAGFKIQRIHYDGYYFYRRRTFFKEGGVMEKFLNSHYPNKNDVSNIPNWLGRILMKPLEIVVIAKKVRNVTSMNEVF